MHRYISLIVAFRSELTDRHLAVASRGYYNTQPLLANSGNYADPDSAEAIASSLADAHYQYCEEVRSKRPVILFVVQEGERNIYDQKAIEDILLHKSVLFTSPRPSLLRREAQY